VSVVVEEPVGGGSGPPEQRHRDGDRPGRSVLSTSSPASTCFRARRRASRVRLQWSAEKGRRADRVARGAAFDLALLAPAPPPATAPSVSPVGDSHAARVSDSGLRHRRSRELPHLLRQRRAFRRPHARRGGQSVRVFQTQMPLNPATAAEGSTTPRGADRDQ
jgi:hypothetical protein